MSGNELKDILVAHGYNISEIATLLGYASSQRLHSALGASDVKTGLIEDIARVTKRNIWDFYPESMRPVGAFADGSSIAVAGNSNNVNKTSEKLIALLEKKDEQIDRLLLIIERLNQN